MAHNLENLGERGMARWVAYDATGKAFRCHRQQAGKAWRAYPSHIASESDSRRFYADKLADLAAMVAASDSRSAAELAYIADTMARPLYHDGSMRPQWSALPDYVRATWGRNPTSRECTLAEES